jgi:hypothetical protein
VKKKLCIPVITLLTLATVLGGCARGADTGSLQFYANGEDFVRQGFVSKDGWSITFDHVYITLSEIAAYQTEPPYDPASEGNIDGKVTVALDGAYTIDLAEGGEDAPPILVAEVPDVAVGHYNAISWKMSRAASGVAAGHSLVIIGTAEKDGQSLDFTINIDEECEYQCGEYVGDVRKGILEKGATVDLEMTFHFDHIFGDGELPQDDELNLGAVGFQPFADGADAATVINMTEMHLGHVGEGHCHCGCN